MYRPIIIIGILKLIFVATHEAIVASYYNLLKRLVLT
jgi:hypothetical protein